MIRFSSSLSDILGSAFYQYELSSSSYNPTIDTNITITCKVKDVLGRNVTGKSLTLYMNGASKGTSTTNSNGVATWTITCNTWGIQDFRVENQAIQVNVNGYKTITATSRLTIRYNGMTRTVMANYVNSSVTTSNTQETVVNNGEIPSDYRPPSDIKVVFNQTGSILFFKYNGNISIRTSSTGTHNVNTTGTWII